MSVVLFGAVWCSYCTTFRPIVESVCAELDVKFEYLDVDEFYEVSGVYGIKKVPSMVVFPEFDEETVFQGSCTREELVLRLKNLQ